MGWEVFIFQLLGAAGALAAIYQSLRKHPERPETPFKSIPLDQLHNVLASPIRFTPGKIDRSITTFSKHGLHLFVGPSGSGKTREAADFAIQTAKSLGTREIFVANRNVSVDSRLPDGCSRRRNIILIDDYDLGLFVTGDESYLRRQAGTAEAISNLNKLYVNLLANTDVFALIVTINLSKAPINHRDISTILPNSHIYNIGSVTKDDHIKFIQTICQHMQVKINDKDLPLLPSIYDGRFDVIATFLNSIEKDSVLDKSLIHRYLSYSNEMWRYYQSDLSSEQREVYNILQLLKSCNMSLHLEYILWLYRYSVSNIRRSDLINIINSIWKIEAESVLIHNCQFQDKKPTRLECLTIVEMILRQRTLTKGITRYSFQRDVKSFIVAGIFSNNRKYKKLLKRLCSWYKNDLFFYYNYAFHCYINNNFLTGILTLYAAFKRQDTLLIYSGKWISIKSHLLLARLYKNFGVNIGRSWQSTQMMEKEYEIAITLAELDIHDSSPDETINDDKFKIEELHSDSTSRPIPIDFSLKHQIKNRLLEYGHEMPNNLPVDMLKLRAMAHHEYASYLLSQLHREYEVFEHESLVVSLMPEFGEAYINCSIASRAIGDTLIALEYAKSAETVPAIQLPPLIHRAFVLREKWLSCEDLGMIDEAKATYSELIDLIEQNTIFQNNPLKEEIKSLNITNTRWEYYKKLSAIRTKKFGTELDYEILPLRINISLPFKWKVNKEHVEFNGVINDFIVIFSSNVIWDHKVRIPSDASIDFFYTTNNYGFSNDIDEFGEQILNNLKLPRERKARISTSLHSRHIVAGNSLYNRYTFSIQSKWPKEGMILVFVGKNFKIKLGCMCESHAKNQYLPQFESLIEGIESWGCLFN